MDIFDFSRVIGNGEETVLRHFQLRFTDQISAVLSRMPEKSLWRKTSSLPGHIATAKGVRFDVFLGGRDRSEADYVGISSAIVVQWYQYFTYCCYGSR